MSDSHTDPAANAVSSKQAYEEAINLSQHVPQAKTISEMVLDAFQSAKESDQIRDLRLAIRAASEGVRAAIGIHKSVIPEERRV